MPAGGPVGKSATGCGFSCLALHPTAWYFWCRRSSRIEPWPLRPERVASMKRMFALGHSYDDLIGSVRKNARSGLTLLLILSAPILYAACGGASSGQGGTSSLTIAGFGPFSGADASFGPNLIAGCYPATRLINMAGGILTHKIVNCQAVDSKGDPADAVPAAQQMLATTSHLVALMGPSSDEATATVPIFEKANLTMMATTGQTAFNHSTFQYFWRNTPADDQDGYAMALYAHKVGYTRGAAIFGNDIASQGEDPTVTRGFAKLGGSMVIDEKLASGQSSYRTEVERLVAAKPDVIFMDLDPQSASVFLSELQQLHGLIPVIGTGVSVETVWLKAVSHAIGASNLFSKFTGVDFYAPAVGAAWQLYQTNMLASAAKVPDPAQWVRDPYSMAAYDGVNIMALAMEAARSTSPPKYNSYLPQVTEARAGAVVVHSFAQGKAALLGGHTIQYVGATGVTAFDKWHNSTGNFEAKKYNGPIGHTVSTFTSADLAAAK